MPRFDYRNQWLGFLWTHFSMTQRTNEGLSRGTGSSGFCLIWGFPSSHWAPARAAFLWQWGVQLATSGDCWWLRISHILSEKLPSFWKLDMNICMWFEIPAVFRRIQCNYFPSSSRTPSFLSQSPQRESTQYILPWFSLFKYKHVHICAVLFSQHFVT